MLCYLGIDDGEQNLWFLSLWNFQSSGFIRCVSLGKLQYFSELHFKL